MKRSNPIYLFACLLACRPSKTGSVTHIYAYIHTLVLCPALEKLIVRAEWHGNCTAYMAYTSYMYSIYSILGM